MYATQQDIEDRCGPDTLLILADRNADGLVDTDMVGRALADAASEIDTYLGVRHELPLAQIPVALVRLCVDIAVYRLAAEADQATDERRNRYNDAVKLLMQVSKGTASLGLPEPAAGSGVNVAVVSGPPRRSSRETLGKLT